jgi:hypothetical protein
MRLLIIGDSHCQEMDSMVKKLLPLAQVFLVTVGAQLPDIMVKYHFLLETIYYFDPDNIHVHFGHNEMARHPEKNPIPSISRDVARETMNVAAELSRNFPSARLCISAIFPRTHTSRSYLTLPEVLKFNKDIDRHALRLRKLSVTAGHMCSVNNPIWLRISKSEEDPSFFLTDGYHLKKEAKLVMARSWLETMGHLTPIPTVTIV